MAEGPGNILSLSNFTVHHLIPDRPFLDHQLKDSYSCSDPPEEEKVGCPEPVAKRKNEEKRETEDRKVARTLQMYKMKGIKVAPEWIRLYRRSGESHRNVLMIDQDVLRIFRIDG